MKRSLLIVLLKFILLSMIPVNAQSLRTETPPLRERVFFAGNIGLQFGTYTNIQLAPSVGIWLLPRLAVAAGPTYQYYKDPFGKTDIWGPRAYTQFLIIQDINNIIPLGIGIGIYTHLEYEGLSLKRDFWINPYDEGRFFLNSALAGFGINQQIGPRSSMTFTILWVLSDDKYQVYSNPEIRIGFMF
ncbi:MAG: hypothetical protein FJY11_01050 [Bacteroidetes bacterium]|nr:hypothetical protein [Bacteroidota bacterium]